MFRIESGDIVMYLKPQARNSEDDEAMRIAMERVDAFDSSYGFPLCPRLPTTIRLSRSEREDAEREDSAVDGDIDDERDTESRSNKMPPLPLRGWWSSGKKTTDDEHLESQAAGKSTSTKSACTCTNGANKKCLFIHGIGVRDNVGVQDDFAEYWGSKVKTALPCCSVVKFTHFNTVDSPWHSRGFAREICNAAAAVAINASYNTSTGALKWNESNSKPVVLKDMVLIAHSTGNLHLASALHYGDCALDPKSSRWLAVQGPMSGSRTANQVIKKCHIPNTTWDDLTRYVLEGFELCPVTGSTQSLILKGSNASASRLDTLYEKAVGTFRASVYANMCGVSAVGILSPSSPRYVALEAFSNHTSKENDGAVEFASCRSGIDASSFAPKHTSRFYKAEINHDDGRMINGDSTWAETRKPLKWLQCQF
uniref:Uncharacterized protein n=1 Tax=Globisporangium ultimum (strain ATCC 200006 / CBS 805.95 / DAOM BR144) TaxID=431595 RepID=K3WWG0_GLOUD